MWVRVPDEYSYIQDHKRKKYVYTDRNINTISTEKRTNKYEPMMSEHQIAKENLDKVELHVHSND